MGYISLKLCYSIEKKKSKVVWMIINAVNTFPSGCSQLNALRLLEACRRSRSYFHSKLSCGEMQHQLAAHHLNG